MLYIEFRIRYLASVWHSTIQIPGIELFCRFCDVKSHGDREMFRNPVVHNVYAARRGACPVTFVFCPVLTVPCAYSPEKRHVILPAEAGKLFSCFLYVFSVNIFFVKYGSCIAHVFSFWVFTFSCCSCPVGRGIISRSHGSSLFQSTCSNINRARHFNVMLWDATSFCMRSWIALLSVGDTAFCSARHCRLRLSDSSRRLHGRGDPRVMC